MNNWGFVFGTFTAPIDLVDPQALCKSGLTGPLQPLQDMEKAAPIKALPLQGPNYH